MMNTILAKAMMGTGPVRSAGSSGPCGPCTLRNNLVPARVGGDTAPTGSLPRHPCTQYTRLCVCQRVPCRKAGLRCGRG
eukprot:scaffold1631_cov101-Isochrysis_galbana.AAC.1